MLPEPIGLAATFDVPLIHDMAVVIGTEARAKHNQAMREGHSNIMGGLQNKILPCCHCLALHSRIGAARRFMSRCVTSDRMHMLAAHMKSKGINETPDKTFAAKLGSTNRAGRISSAANS